ELVRVEELRIRPELYARAGVALADGADRFEPGADLAILEADVVFLTGALDPALEVLRQRIHYRDADAVQAAGELVVLVGEFGAGVQPREYELGSAHLLLGMDVDRHATAVILHLQRSVLEQRDVDLLAVAGDRLIDAVVDDLVREVIGALGVGVHARPPAHGLASIAGSSSKRRKCTAEVFSSFVRGRSSSAIANTRSWPATCTQQRASMPRNFASARTRSTGCANSISSVTFQLPPSGI